MNICDLRALYDSHDVQKSVRFDLPQTPARTSGSEPIHGNLSSDEALHLWEHANLLFHNYEWEEAILEYRRIIKKTDDPLFAALISVNEGIVRCHLGEYYLASEAFARAGKYDNNLAISSFLLGIAKFELEEFRKAKRAFQTCYELIRGEVGVLDYGHSGLNFVLEKVDVERNILQSTVERNHKQHGASLPLGGHCTLNRLPAGRVFEPAYPTVNRSSGGRRSAVQSPGWVVMQSAAPQEEATRVQPDIWKTLPPWPAIKPAEVSTQSPRATSKTLSKSLETPLFLAQGTFPTNHLDKQALSVRFTNAKTVRTDTKLGPKPRTVAPVADVPVRPPEHCNLSAPESGYRDALLDDDVHANMWEHQPGRQKVSEVDRFVEGVPKPSLSESSAVLRSTVPLTRSHQRPDPQIVSIPEVPDYETFKDYINELKQTLRPSLVRPSSLLSTAGAYNPMNAALSMLPTLGSPTESVFAGLNTAKRTKAIREETLRIMEGGERRPFIRPLSAAYEEPTTPLVEDADEHDVDTMDSGQIFLLGRQAALAAGDPAIYGIRGQHSHSRLVPEPLRIKVSRCRKARVGEGDTMDKARDAMERMQYVRDHVG
ncbi:hypothetical protein LTR16_000033 [Cryomyces antarcticus]|uniref:Uncharacterized protein n=1 Tax=Cryomyces antarcticus TaxID=329879 RepID=A0ABR0M0G2_9PEZI|nr:hypothetical protein LTR60_001668 [Cryomyces antarcticus]KAK5019010.1 hypothetical protein LTR39_000647 [Cryomyces antarcticus]KAK5257626.1 hypothetical protein LTR16_000033 [Cryomyces antarcticus]